MAAALPGAGSAVVDLTTAVPKGTAPNGAAPNAAAPYAAPQGAGGRAGTLPVSVVPAAHQGNAPMAAGAGAGADSTPTRVRVTTADQAVAQRAGVHGLLFAVEPADAGAGAGSATVSVDPSSFRAAFGGDYASRLHLVELPSCALTTPELAKCQVQTPVQADPAKPLTATVHLAPAAQSAGQVTPFAATAAGGAAPQASSSAVVLAATSSPTGSSGTYTATSLSPTGTWSAGGNTGAFTYSYPVQVPKAIAGATPDVSLSYDSSSQDGRTAGTNNQSSWLGDGWSSSESYIERSYKSCASDSTSGAPQGSGDECWAGQLLTMSLNGKSTQLVYDDASHTLRPASDESTVKIEQLYGASNGTYNGEYFRVTQDGVQYYFGLNQLPGYTSGQQATQSVYTVPVYGAHAGDPCNSSSFAGSSCVQGWRWNLDYSVDPHSNAIAYYYQPETNYYGADAQSTGVAYTRGGYLQRIDYGMTAGTVYSGTAPEQIVFSVNERCIPGTPVGAVCDDAHFGTTNASWWPDVPTDQSCAQGSTCTDFAPTYWSRKRLASITTQVQVGGATQQVDRYDFTQSFPDGGDHAPTLWLDSIQHTGLDTSAGGSGQVSNPVTGFDPPRQSPNRVGTVPNESPMYHDRIQSISTETGARITVAYNDTQCTPANVPSDPSTNTMPCFPVMWTPPGSSAPVLDWFHKYTVHSVKTADPNTSYQDGSFPELLTTYNYVGGAAWHYDDNELVKPEDRTYGQFRGYQTVETRSGDPAVFHLTNGTQVNDALTLAKTTYFRGMSNNTPNGSGGSTVTLTSQDGAHSAQDVNSLAGQVFETDTYTGDGGSIDHATVTIPTIIGPTASRARNGLAPLTAQMVRTANSYSRQAVSYGWRNTETDSFYNTTLGQPTTGMVVQSDDRGEPTANGNVAKCTFTRYASNSGAALALTAETITTAQDCTGGGATPSGTLVSDTRASYDGNAFTWDGAGGGTAPSKGDVTLNETASASNGATATAYLATAKTGYDSYGRVTSTVRTPNSTAPDGSSLAQSTTTAYTPASGGLPTGVVSTVQVTAGGSPTYQTTTTTLDAARGVPVTKVDPAHLRTDLTYDALGRLTAVWLPTQSKAANQAATMTYSYLVSNTAAVVVTSNKLLENGSYAPTENVYDALLRPLQVQTAGENNTVVVSDTQYDSHGWTVLTNNSYSANGSPQPKELPFIQLNVPDTTVTDYDGMGRPTTANEERSTTTSAGAAIQLTPAGMVTQTAYTGDTTTVFPKSGGVVTRTAVNARGQNTELDQYTTAPSIGGSAQAGWTTSGGAFNATSYGYTPAGQQATITGPDQAVWTSSYDLLGRRTQQADPDAGTSKYGFDDAGNQVSATDARGIELDYTYDLLGRKLTAVDKSNNNFKFGVWKYDSLQVGKLSYSARYVPGASAPYVVMSKGYTALGQSTGTEIKLPAEEAPLPTDYTTTNSFSTSTEELLDQRDPGVGGLLTEDVLYGYDGLDNPVTMQSVNAIAGPVTYTPQGEISAMRYGPSNNTAQTTYGYDDQTRRLTSTQTSRTQAPGPIVDALAYTYDPSGNPTSTVDQQSENGSTATDTQCYQYDSLDRLTQAWTAAGACPAAGTNPTNGSIATGPTAYWQSFGYDNISDRTASTDHAVNGASADTTTTYTNGAAGGAQPHTLTGTSTTGPAGTTSTSFSYTPAGQLTGRTPTVGTGQTLHWNDEGQLDQVTQGGNTTNYLYDADGNQLIRRDPGQTTLFLGDTEVTINTSTTPATILGAVRTYTLAGQNVAIASTLPGGGVSYVFSDPHGTATMTMDTTTQKLTRQQYKPYGELRGGATTGWIDPTRGFLNKPVDATTGYTDVGARKYDPTLGRFISADPVLEGADPGQLGGYTYAGSNPLTFSDPTGQMHDPGCGYNGCDSGFVGPPLVAITGGGTGGSSGSGGSGDPGKSSTPTFTPGASKPSKPAQVCDYTCQISQDPWFRGSMLCSGAGVLTTGCNAVNGLAIGPGNLQSVLSAATPNAVDPATATGDVARRAAQARWNRLSPRERALLQAAKNPYMRRFAAAMGPVNLLAGGLSGYLTAKSNGDSQAESITIGGADAVVDEGISGLTTKLLSDTPLGPVGGAIGGAVLAVPLQNAANKLISGAADWLFK
ncbi:RHS repeat-associated core domain-containing protein [Kitasatospora viridis]|uniref:RHS repeat-associated core domain-containing protein n=1 Tax=Kitasatospora viridis TaxID=281105 RepID=UPI00119DFCB0|nr:RHS repeat-associated core domain-containing protein [Kitasatospora viridis]